MTTTDKAMDGRTIGDVRQAQRRYSHVEIGSQRRRFMRRREDEQTLGITLDKYTVAESDCKPGSGCRGGHSVVSIGEPLASDDGRPRL
ncbi:hypothetical protein HID58_075202 [Brassica napus]|uniref:Uncharacterized protein n=1 Tax=Brassica napus TaxID=3708 RepID=A0ABQ7YJ13_BRANA|nr:hypothetical protein HID58_075202 [Brassica napus]